MEVLNWAPHETAVIICDMWDTHWCKRASERCSLLALQLEGFASAVRERGTLVVHAPSDTMSFYAGMPQRERARQVKRVKPPLPIRMRSIDPDREGPLPIVDSDGGCDDDLPRPHFSSAPWTRQHPAIAIAPQDIISDDGKEIYSILVRSGIKNIFMTGVHTNKCVLARPFGIRQMVLLGINVVLVRDLTDSLYNPSMPPMVSHQEGTRLIVEHIEKYWCPSITCADVTPLRG
jgi:nicotinamidase-related amidase